MLRLLNCEPHCYGEPIAWNGEMSVICGMCESTTWLDLLVDLCAPRRRLKISETYICPVLQLSKGLLILK